MVNVNDHSPHFDFRTGLLRGRVNVNKKGSVTVVSILTQGNSFSEITTIKLKYFILRLRCCAKNWKVAGSIPAGVSGIFIDIKSFRSHYGPGVDSASNRNEYQEYFLEVKAAGV